MDTQKTFKRGQAWKTFSGGVFVIQSILPSESVGSIGRIAGIEVESDLDVSAAEFRADYADDYLVELLHTIPTNPLTH